MDTNYVSSSLAAATFFSTTFFGFNGDLEGRVYSKWLWLYFVVTVVLTAIVIIGTWFLWAGKESELSRRLETRSKEASAPPEMN